MTTATTVGCHCDPPGSGEEHCTGHCILRAENERLAQLVATQERARTALAAEVVRLRTELERIEAGFLNDRLPAIQLANLARQALLAEAVD